VWQAGNALCNLPYLAFKYGALQKLAQEGNVEVMKGSNKIQKLSVQSVVLGIASYAG
jgi:hypothetical protein